jgi:LysM repeat protein
MHLCRYNIYTMKKLLILLFTLPFFAFAQQKTIQHTVAAKESFSSIGRLYNVNGREIANFNKIDYATGLAIGQVLKIPVTNNTPIVAAPTPVVKEKVIAKENVVVVTGKEPIKHIVTKKQTLYAVSKMYNVKIEDIKKWNNLTADALSEGAEIIVGYGATKTNKTVTKVEPQKVETKPVEIAKAKEISTPKEPVKIKQPVATPAPKVVKNTEVIREEDNAKDFNGGIFKTLYTDLGKQETGTAGVFKSTSGWEDGKYYCLHNSAQQGTIVKITNKANGKFIYAKVLDLMPDLKQNNTLQIRISNAAADILGAGLNNFECAINY